MANIFFIVLFIIGITYGLITGRVEEISRVLISSPKEAFFIFFEMSCMLVFWSGILEIAKASGLLTWLTRKISFVLHPLFKNLDKNSKAMEYISMNIAANMLGVGSAATPFGLKAMKELDELNNHSDEASEEMITLLVINVSGICLIPSSIIALRLKYCSNNPSAVLPFIIIVSTCTTITAILLNLLFQKIERKRNGKP